VQVTTNEVDLLRRGIQAERGGGFTQPRPRDSSSYEPSLSERSEDITPAATRPRANTWPSSNAAVPQRRNSLPANLSAEDIVHTPAQPQSRSPSPDGSRRSAGSGSSTPPRGVKR